jgi:phage replication-related protein YjqB (UPF0714/DUF867 family)
MDIVGLFQFDVDADNEDSRSDVVREGSPPMLDTYHTVEDLLAQEQDHVEIDRRIDGRSRIAVLAPHAGDIEPFTGEIARAVAGKDHRFYGFAGKAPDGNARLHVTSTRFDEPTLRTVLSGARTAISIHGANGDEDAVTLIGGVNRTLMMAIQRTLEQAGFAVMAAPPHLAGGDPRNVVNRVPEGGVQLELTRRLRDDLRRGFLRKVRFDCYVQAIRAALAENELQPGPRWESLRTRSASPAA